MAKIDYRAPTYRSWENMMGRCYNENDKNYPETGGSGILVYAPWHDFFKFQEDMGEKPRGSFLARIDKTKGFYPENVFWSMRKDTRKDSMYTIWRGVKRRSGVTSHQPLSYARKGITMCERWMKYENFVEDMGPRPTQHHTIERIDNSKGYYPENCRWATRMEQANNTDTAVYIELDGVRMSLSAWAREYDIPISTFYARFQRLFFPEKKNNRKVIMISDTERRIFDNIKEASAGTGVSRAAIGKCLSGGNMTAGGFRWEYMNE